MTYEKCPNCPGLRLGDGWCEACDAESDRLNPPEAPEPRMAAIRAEIAETAGAIEATDERTPMPDVAGYAELLARIPEGYTKGPWHAEDGGPENDHAKSTIGVWAQSLFDAALTDSDLDPMDEAWVCGIWGTIGEEDRDNADLIALAPELVDALRTTPAAILRYLYAEAGVRARMLGATDAERLAHAAVRQDIRELAERFGVELEG